MSVPSILVSLLFSLPHAAVAAEARAPEPAPQQLPPFVGPTSGDQPDPEGMTLYREYVTHLKTYEERRMKLSLGGKVPDPKDLGTHPVHDYEARFRALADQGSGVAQVWMLDNWEQVGGTADALELGRRFEALFERLIENNASQAYMTTALDAVRVQRAQLGLPRVERLLERVQEKTANKEIAARAALMRAMLRAPEKPDAPDAAARLEEMREMQRTVVAAWPGTKAALEAAAILAPGVNEEFERRTIDWCAACLALSKQGRPTSEWPPMPVDAMLPLYAPLAAAGGPSGVRWVNHFYNGIINARAQGPGRDLAAAARGLGVDYKGATPLALGARIGLYELLFQQYGGEPWVAPSFDELADSAESLTPELAERAFAPVFARNLDLHAKAAGLHVLTRAWLAIGTYPSYERALATCDRLARECAGDPLVAATQKLCEAPRRNRVGEPAPVFESQDAENKRFSLADYRGRVVLLAFFNMFVEQGLDDQSSWREFQAQNLARPFNVVGVNAGPMERQKFYDRAAKLGLSFRTALLYRSSEENTERWAIKRFPTTVAIDADGVIRGRDLPWPEMRALLEKLVAEAEAKNAKR